jgi:hypothetical protein
MKVMKLFARCQQSADSGRIWFKPAQSDIGTECCIVERLRRYPYALYLFIIDQIKILTERLDAQVGQRMLKQLAEHLIRHRNSVRAR